MVLTLERDLVRPPNQQSMEHDKNATWTLLHATLCGSQAPGLRTCVRFQKWLISATGSVAMEHPHPSTASFGGPVVIIRKKVSRDVVLSHWGGGGGGGGYLRREGVVHVYV